VTGCFQCVVFFAHSIVIMARHCRQHPQLPGHRACYCPWGVCKCIFKHRSANDSKENTYVLQMCTIHLIWQC